mmetsp:Transcript_22351/g.62537  ORF Transcript_22351/g.62537 Transcript_22351/m.62537 type:complete len:303 (-) Transcript_22351:216-1124(-)
MGKSSNAASPDPHPRWTKTLDDFMSRCNILCRCRYSRPPTTCTSTCRSSSDENGPDCCRLRWMTSWSEPSHNSTQSTYASVASSPAIGNGSPIRRAPTKPTSDGWSRPRINSTSRPKSSTMSAKTALVNGRTFAAQCTGASSAPSRGCATQRRTVAPLAPRPRISPKRSSRVNGGNSSSGNALCPKDCASCSTSRGAGTGRGASSTPVLPTHCGRGGGRCLQTPFPRKSAHVHDGAKLAFSAPSQASGKIGGGRCLQVPSARKAAQVHDGAKLACPSSGATRRLPPSTAQHEKQRRGAMAPS